MRTGWWLMLFLLYLGVSLCSLGIKHGISFLNSPIVMVPVGYVGLILWVLAMVYCFRMYVSLRHEEMKKEKRL